MEEKNKIPFLQIEPTNRCNFSCKFCCGRKFKPNQMTMETFERIITAVKDVKHIQLQGEGEPFLQPCLFEMIDLIQQFHPNAKISITSNGTFFQEEVILKLLERKVYSILVSIESVNKEYFHYLRGGNLEEIILKLKLFVKLKKEYGCNLPKLGLAVTILKSTIPEIKLIVNLYKELNLDGEFTVQYLQNMKIYADVYNDDMKKQMLSTDEISEFQNSLKEDRELDDFFSNHHNDGGFFDELYSSVSENSTCPWLENGMYITAEGSVTGCSYIKENTQSFGNIKDNGLEIILSKRSQLHQSLGNGFLPKCCSDCPDMSM